MDLAGRWLGAVSDDDLRRAMTDPGFDDSGWVHLDVPGHWSSHPDFAGVDGPVLYRRRFEASPPAAGRRSFLTFDGIFYQGDVWLDNAYLGDTEGYFFPHTFEVTDALRAGREHVLAVEVTCARPEDRTAKRNLTGVFQHWDCIDPAWNPGGIWAGVRLGETGPIRIRHTKVLCREANEDRATLELETELDTVEPVAVTVTTTLTQEGEAEPATVNLSDQELAAGINVVRWQVAVERPALWWPRALGEQPLYRVEIEVRPSSGPENRPEPSDTRVLTTGLRQIRVRNFIATVNGERLFLKGINCAPTRRALGEATAADLERDVTLARQAGLDLLRVHAHITRPELYDAADRQGMLVWQDMPLQWGYAQVRRQAAAQARQAVNLLGHHPSIAVWCGHNEPMAIDVKPGMKPGPRLAARMAAATVLPSYNKTALDRSIQRALERADGTREVVAHSGIMPHPAWGTDTHFYFGWYHGDERDLPKALARTPVVARFVSEFGAQAVPDSAEFMNPKRWPDLDWEDLEAHHCLQRAVFAWRVPPDAYLTFEGWKKATQDYQATVLRYHIETLRRLKYRPTGGFCVFMLGDAQPAVSWAVVDHNRVPKSGYSAVAAACAPVIVVADRPNPSYRPGDKVGFDIHAVSDLRAPLPDVTAEAVLHWPGGRKAWRFGGEVGADTCVRIGRLTHGLPPDTPAGPLTLELTLAWAEGQATNSYVSRVTPEK